MRIAFKGSRFHGWQKQPNALAVQEVLEQSLRTLFREEVEVIGCGRTDTGVHAANFYCHFDLSSSISVNQEQCYKLNAILDPDIAVLDFFQVKDDFHARFNAVSRSYLYRLHTQKDPFLNGFSTYLNKVPDLNAMQSAANLLKMHREFGAFCKSHSDNKTNFCKISEVEWKQSAHQLSFHITADRFLRNMVRAIVGTLLEVGFGKMDLEEFEKVIESGDRSRAGMSVSADGLYLSEVNYQWEQWRI